MADAEDDVVEATDARKEKEKKHNTGSADLERVTDFSEEKEISGDKADSVCMLVSLVVLVPLGCQSVARGAEEEASPCR